MLYRPCLIKLVDSDDPEKWEYHLREQKLPFLVALAHEFLHALNQLERIDQYWDSDLVGEYNKTGDLLNTLCNAIFMQNFLADKLRLKDGIDILSDKYLSLWGNEDNDDFLDEMTVILGSKRQIDLDKIAFVGETTFLREYYKDKSIISWSHCPARDLEFWQKMSIILEKKYVNKILFEIDFGLNTIVLSIDKEKTVSAYTQVFEYNNSFNMSDNLKSAEIEITYLIENRKAGIVYVHGKRNNKIEKVEIFKILKTNNPHIVLLPKYSKMISLENYESKKLFKMGDMCLGHLDDNVFKNLKKIETITKKHVLLLINDQALSYKYWYSLNPTKIYSEAKNVEKILNKYPDAIKLYFDDTFFQIIVEK